MNTAERAKPRAGQGARKKNACSSHPFRFVFVRHWSYSVQGTVLVRSLSVHRKVVAEINYSKQSARRLARRSRALRSESGRPGLSRPCLEATPAPTDGRGLHPWCRIQPIEQTHTARCGQGGVCTWQPGDMGARPVNLSKLVNTARLARRRRLLPLSPNGGRHGLWGARCGVFGAARVTGELP